MNSLTGHSQSVDTGILHKIFDKLLCNLHS
nr:MAG TPA: hypothetical protein [Caudoviricetes sp.]